ncbi:aminotransferase class I/II-fold pyridoxal phosphate-dependent enzyme [Vibrio sp. CAIM 722]|uniref:Aminotransferase class I/II-fold pyridoxal phosphate-dependent enzyme n=1 Tax=Vibrio eleionomae TaxID=2653505 RepID=A0A7X4RWA0_9VIBR|nr:PLP-dependent aminotransferase family protein [Vibrio eleionomae]MZI94989.1 aminotransferase class I/II-fold pyridoxal phosphate-dependent enzyme [Vibrio eleionomae]
MSIYSELADIISSRIEKGYYSIGQRLPSLRLFSKENDVSLGTAQRAYTLLEEKGLIEPKSRSGYYVRKNTNISHCYKTVDFPQEPVEVPKWDDILDLTFPPPSSNLIQLGRGLPNIEVQTLKPLLTSLSRSWVKPDLSALYYDEIKGLYKLREQISRLLIDSETQVAPEEIIITPGCHAALSIAIRSICTTGDVVVTDSPCFHGILNSLQNIGAKVIEVSSSKNQGMSLEALELALEQWPVKAILVTPNCNNPLGYIMPEDKKKDLYLLARKFDVAIIEDDIYGDLAYKYPRPRTIKSYDIDGRVLLCSSFSKTLAPGLRVGWIVPGRYLEKASYNKYSSALFLSAAPQKAIVNFIEAGFYLTHVKRMRNLYARNLAVVKQWVELSFPEDVVISEPQGGYMLWIELPKKVSVTKLNEELINEGIQISTGRIFSVSDKYNNCIRINFGARLSPRIKNAIYRIGNSIKNQLL